MASNIDFSERKDPSKKRCQQQRPGIVLLVALIV
jgi:hypothetical protein